MIDSKIMRFTRQHRRLLLECAKNWWRTRIKLIEEKKTTRNRQICDSKGKIKLSAAAIKMKLWNVGANVTSIQKGRGKRKWSHKISEIHKKKHYNQNILTEMTGFSKKSDEKIPKPQTIEDITKDLQKKFIKDKQIY